MGGWIPFLYIADGGTNLVTAYNLAAGAVTATIQVGTIVTGSGPWDVVVSPVSSTSTSPIMAATTSG
jgi:hypothetical protein